MTELTKEEIEMIEKDGVTYCNSYHKGGDRTYNKCFESYMEGAIKERLKAKELIEALEWAFKKDGYQYIKDILDNYNKSKQL